MNFVTCNHILYFIFNNLYLLFYIKFTNDNSNFQ